MRDYKVGSEPVPGYRLTRFLGRGGFGQVWEARGPGGVDVALKIISLEGSHGLKEFRAVGLVKRLHNPNLIPLHGYWLRDEYGTMLDPTQPIDTISLRGRSKELIIAMGLGEMSLAQRLDECRRGGLPGIPIDELIDYMTGAARAIDYLNQPIHNTGGKEPGAIQHCDIKPGNLLVVGNGIQVCDYGLARALTSDIRATQSAGTPAYSAPELFANKPSKATDQYSLAITYYELRTGKLPFEEDSAAHANIMGTLDFSALPPAEQAVIKRATHMRPDERFPTSVEMVRCLRDAVVTKGPAPAPVVKTIDERLHPGQELVPHYRLVRLLGRGGYGEVWQTRGPGGKQCALKVVRNLDAGTGRQEYRALDLIRDLEHDRLINLQAYWVLAADGTIIPDDEQGTDRSPTPSALIMATDLAAKNLMHRLQECQSAGKPGIPVAELLHYAKQTGEAIDYLNNNAIQHRDIKPENILLTRDNRVKVSDFGLAKLVEGSTAAINAASIGLTTAYAAPEVFKNNVSRWTDQYSLAITYYKLRMGQWPFAADLGPYQMMIAHAEGKLQFNGLEEPEQKVLARATMVEPSARYPTCQEFIADLIAAIGVQPVQPAELAVAAGALGARIQEGGRGSNPSKNLDPTHRAVPAALSAPTMNYDSPEAQRMTPPVGDEHTAPSAPSGQSTLIQNASPAPAAAAKPDLPFEFVSQILLDPQQRAIPAEKPKDWRPKPAGRKQAAAGWLIASGVLFVGLAGGGGYWLATRDLGPPEPTSPQPTSPQPSARKPDDKPDDKPLDIPDPARAAAEKEIGDSLIRKDYAQAAWRAKTAGDHDWAKALREQARTGWRAQAMAETDAVRKLKRLEEFVAAFPDADASTEINRLKAEMARNRDAAVFATALASLGAAKLDDALAALKPLQSQSGSARLRADALVKQIEALRQAAAGAKDVATLASLRKLTTDGLPDLASDDRTALHAAGSLLLARAIEPLIPNLTAKTNWAELAAACAAAAKTPAVLACRVESAIEQKRAVEGPDALALAAAAPAPYTHYAQALLGAGPADDGSAVANLLAAFPKVGGVTGDHRAGRALAIIVATIDRWRAKAPGGKAFPEDRRASAVEALALASRLADRPELKVAPERKARLAVNRLLAVDQDAKANPADVRAAAEAVVQPDILDVVRPRTDAYAALIVHARASRAKPDGRAAAAASALKALGIAKSEPAALLPARLYADLVKPLLDPALTEPKDAATRTAEAKLLATLAETIRADVKGWVEVKDLGDNAPSLALDCYDRAAKLDDRPEYAVERTFARIEQGAEIEPAKWAAIAKRATAESPTYYGGPLLEGAANLHAANDAGQKLDDVIERLNAADSRFAAALPLCTKSLDKSTAWLGRSAAALRLANSTFDRAAIAKHLKFAVTYAENAKSEDPTRAAALAALGAALEDRAYLLGDIASYQSAVSAFLEASDTGIGAFKIKPILNRGRCQYRWAAAEKNRARLNLAIADLDDVSGKRAIAPAAAVEADYFLAKARICERDLVRAENPSAAEAAVKAAEASFKAAAKLAATKAPTWTESILNDHAMLEIEEARARLAPLEQAQKWTAYRNDQDMKRLVDEADRIAEEFKPVNTARWAYLKGQTTLLKFEGGVAAVVPAALALFAQGLESKRPQDRPAQVDIRRESVVLYWELKKYEDVVANAAAGDELAELIGAKPEIRADFQVRQAKAKFFISQAKADPKLLEQVLDHYRAAIKLDPDNGEAWSWKFDLAFFLRRGDSKAKAEAIKLLEEARPKAPDKQRPNIDQLMEQLKAKAP